MSKIDSNEKKKATNGINGDNLKKDLQLSKSFLVTHTETHKTMRVKAKKLCESQS
jgi:hypothetical protein